VDEERGGLDAVSALDLAAGGVHHHQVARRHFRPVQALRVDQEMAGAPGDLQAEVIADALAVAEPVRPAQRRRQIDPRFSFRVPARHRSKPKISNHEGHKGHEGLLQLSFLVFLCVLSVLCGSGFGCCISRP
jgi:hypothetical protein